jgi:hypothetical protein
MKEETVTQEKINEWKAKYKFVYKAAIDGIDYYFRTLDRDDYLTISAKQASLGQALDYELETVKTCLLNDMDEDTIKAKAGIVTILSERIMAKSGFLQVEEEEL